MDGNSGGGVQFAAEEPDDNNDYPALDEGSVEECTPTKSRRRQRQRTESDSFVEGIDASLRESQSGATALENVLRMLCQRLVSVEQQVAASPQVMESKEGKETMVTFDFPAAHPRGVLSLIERVDSIETNLNERLGKMEAKLHILATNIQGYDSEEEREAEEVHNKRRQTLMSNDAAIRPAVVVDDVSSSPGTGEMDAPAPAAADADGTPQTPQQMKRRETQIAVEEARQAALSAEAKLRDLVLEQERKEADVREQHQKQADAVEKVRAEAQQAKEEMEAMMRAMMEEKQKEYEEQKERLEELEKAPTARRGSLAAYDAAQWRASASPSVRRRARNRWKMAIRKVKTTQSHFMRRVSMTNQRVDPKHSLAQRIERVEKGLLEVEPSVLRKLLQKLKEKAGTEDVQGIARQAEGLEERIDSLPEELERRTTDIYRDALGKSHGEQRESVQALIDLTAASASSEQLDGAVAHVGELSQSLRLLKEQVDRSASSQSVNDSALEEANAQQLALVGTVEALKDQVGSLAASIASIADVQKALTEVKAELSNSANRAAGRDEMEQFVQKLSSRSSDMVADVGRRVNTVQSLLDMKAERTEVEDIETALRGVQGNLGDVSTLRDQIKTKADRRDVKKMVATLNTGKDGPGKNGGCGIYKVPVRCLTCDQPVPNVEGAEQRPQQEDENVYFNYHSAASSSMTYDRLMPSHQILRGRRKRPKSSPGVRANGRVVAGPFGRSKMVYTGAGQGTPHSQMLARDRDCVTYGQAGMVPLHLELFDSVPPTATTTAQQSPEIMSYGSAHYHIPPTGLALPMPSTAFSSSAASDYGGDGSPMQIPQKGFAHHTTTRTFSG